MGLREMSTDDLKAMLPIRQKFIRVINDEDNETVLVGVSPDTWIPEKKAWQGLEAIGWVNEDPNIVWGYPGKFWNVECEIKPDEVENRVRDIILCLPDFETKSLTISQINSREFGEESCKSLIKTGFIGKIPYIRMEIDADGSRWVAEKMSGVRKVMINDADKTLIIFRPVSLHTQNLPYPLFVGVDQNIFPSPLVILRKDRWMIKVFVAPEMPAMVSAMLSISLSGKLVDDNSQPIHIFPSNEWIVNRKKFEEYGIIWIAEEFDPEKPWDNKVDIVPNKIPGWEAPAGNGKILHGYQKEAVLHSLSRGNRVLFADQMGLGKTAQALAVGAAVNSKRTLVVVPSCLRYVWLDEIKGWYGIFEDKIQLISDKLDSPRPDATFIILTFEQISFRSEIWKNPPKELVRVMKSNLKEGEFFYKSGQSLHFLSPFPPSIEERINKALIGKELIRWKKIMARLRNDLLVKIEELGFDLLIIDEAHRVKNHKASRTEAAKRLSKSAKIGCLALSGTPIQNNTREPATLLEVIDPSSFSFANQGCRISIDRLKHFLGNVMIRRLKEDVLKDLPPLVEQIVRIGGQDLDQIGENFWDDIIEVNCDPPDWASEKSGGIQLLASAWSNARFAPFSQWQEELGIGKACHPHTLDFIEAILEEKDCCVIFVENHAVSDSLFEILSKKKISCVIVDGRTPPLDRHRVINEFNSKLSRTQCLIAGMEAIGEGFTIIRPDTCIFLQIFKKPSVMQQARERLHRIGQKAATVTAYYLVSNNDLDKFWVELNKSKGLLISNILEEKVQIVGESIDQVEVAPN